MWRKILLAFGALVLVVVGIGLVVIGPRDLMGMLRYDQRSEGKLKVGDRAPDVELVALDGARVHLAQRLGDKPTVLVFGSFT